METKLRKLRGNDAEALAGILADDDMHAYLNELPRPYTKNRAAEYITACLNRAGSGFWSFAIEAEGRLAGCISAERGQGVYRLSAEIGYYVAKPLWGNKIATSAIENMCGFIFENTDIIRIYAHVFEGNLASERALANNGFLFEGTLRSAAVKNNKIFDLKLYSKIKT